MLLPISSAKIKKKKKTAISIVDENVNKGHPFIVGRSVNWSVFLEGSLAVPIKIQYICIPFDPAVLLLEIKKVKGYRCKNVRCSINLSYQNIRNNLNVP